MEEVLSGGPALVRSGVPSRDAGRRPVTVIRLGDVVSGGLRRDARRGAGDEECVAIEQR